MNKIWPLQTAKNYFSQVIRNALNDGPQVITRRGEEVAVVIGISDYQALCRQKSSLVDFLLDSPLHSSHLVIERDE